jgi:streptogramin lyase
VAQVNNDGTIRRYPTTILASTPGRPFGIQRPSYGPVVASDNRGHLWFVSTLDKRLLRRVGPSGKAVTQYTVPRFAGPPTNAVFGPDGNLWIALDGPNKWILARVSLR